jgi:hypothetical protein
MVRFVGHVVHMENTKKSYRVLMGKLEGNRLLGRSKQRRDDYFQINLRDTGWSDADWLHFA